MKVFGSSSTCLKLISLFSLLSLAVKLRGCLTFLSEIIYGAKPSYEDPARYSFAHGGKDSVPEPINVSVFDSTIETLEKAIKRVKIENKEKESAIKRLHNLITYGQK